MKMTANLLCSLHTHNTNWSIYFANLIKKIYNRSGGGGGRAKNRDKKQMMVHSLTLKQTRYISVV